MNDVCVHVHIGMCSCVRVVHIIIMYICVYTVYMLYEYKLLSVAKNDSGRGNIKRIQFCWREETRVEHIGKNRVEKKSWKNDYTVEGSTRVI